MATTNFQQLHAAFPKSFAILFELNQARYLGITLDIQVNSQKMKNRQVMLELVKKFREKNKRRSQTEIDRMIENTVKD